MIAWELGKLGRLMQELTWLGGVGLGRLVPT
jgi:hypothetical protein